MKKALFTLAVVLFAVVVQAQTAFKVHSNGQISLQSVTTSYGIQISNSGILSIEPNVTDLFGITGLTKARGLLAKAWDVKLQCNAYIPDDSFYVLGNGNVFAYGNYLTYSGPPDPNLKGYQPIDGATELVMAMNGYYLDSNEFEGVTSEDLASSPNVLPEALEGLLKDLEKEKVVGMYAEELEEVLPEAVRHTPEGNMAINYNAIIPVLIEAFKEQQARIEQMESILRENGLLNSKK